MPNFEVFTKRLSPRVKEPYVTIQKRGTMSMNRASHELLGEPEAVELLFDASAQVVGMRAVDPSAKHAYPLRGSGKSKSSFLLSGRAFAMHYGLDTEMARRYPAVFRDGVLQVDLKGESHEVVSNRNKAALSEKARPDAPGEAREDSHDSFG